MKNLLISLCAIIALVACTESDVDNIGNSSGGQEPPKQPETTLNTPPVNEIWYTSTDGKIVIPDASTFGSAEIVSNVYENGKGIITFDGEITAIADYAFYYKEIQSIAIPNSVTQIGDYAFRECDNLTYITIPDGVTEIGEDAFCGCSSLTSINIPDGVTQIGDNAFWGCSSLTSITFPKSVEGIGRDAFYKVKVVYCMATQPPLLGEPEDSSSYTEYIYVPTNSVDTYKTSDGWKEYADKIVGYDF